MASFCGSAFWDAQRTWNTTSPDFTSCFHETILVWVPCLFLCIASPYEFHKFRRASLNNNNLVKIVPWTLQSILRVFFVLLLAVLSSLELINAFVHASHQVDYCTSFVKLATFCYASLLITLNRKKAICSSGVLFLFWQLFAVGSLLSCWSIFTHFGNHDSFFWKLGTLLFTVRIIEIPLVFAEWILACFSDGPPPAKEAKNVHPEVKASFLSRLAFSWFTPTVVLGYKKPLTVEDTYDLTDYNLASDAFEKFCEHWSFERHPKILWPLIRTFWRELVIANLLKIVGACLTFVNPVLLNYILAWMSSDGPLWQGFFYAVCMFCSALCESMFNNQYEYRNMCNAMRMKAAVSDALYRKSLKLSPSARGEVTTGQVINLLSVDTQRIIDYLTVVNYCWISPLQIGIALYLLWAQLGVASLAGLGVLLALLPINAYITKRYRMTQVQLMISKDERSKLMNEVLNGIKVLKMYGWEASFRDLIKSVREKELVQLRVQTIFMTILSLTFGCVSIFVSIASFVTFMLIDENNVLDASKAFVSLALFNLLKIPLIMVPILISMGSTFVVSMNRMDKFLCRGELDTTEITHNHDEENALVVSNGEFAWSSEEADATLKNISVNVKRGKLIAVVGNVGSGKSSLMSAILGDMNKLKGTVNISGSLAYVPQQAWIQNATVKKNIIFTSEMDEEKYDGVMDACALKPDLKILDAGDMTEIGEKGINLSGGQKQRISLARAVYANCDIYLLDDPLSAVDSHVGKHIFDYVIGPNGMLKKKTRVLVTHRIALLPQVDEIIVMKDCQVSEQGSYQELLEKKGDFADFLVEYLSAEVDENSDEAALEEIKAEFGPELARRKSTLSSSPSKGGSRSRSGTLVERTRSIGSTGGDKPTQVERGKLTEAEVSQTGSLKAAIYMEYIRTIGTYACLITLASYIVASGLRIGSSIWLSKWSEDFLSPERAADTGQRNLRLGVYAALGLSEASTLYFANVFLFFGTLRASQKIHDMMLSHILTAPMSFFDTTPLGRILNRFTKDVDSNDVPVRNDIRMVVVNINNSLVTLLIISMQTPWFLIPVIPLMITYYFVQRYYVMTSRQLRRIESTSRSPIYSHFSESFTGSTCIRAFGATDLFNKQCEEKINKNNQCYVMSLTSASWLSVRIEMLGNMIVFFAAVFAISSRDSINASTAGLSISYALTATLTLNMLVKSFATMENDLVAVERCLEYTKTPTEAPLQIEATKPKEGWPHEGVVRFENYSARYREGTDLILREVSFEVASKQKVGIVGRTGAGKSSLTVALFRIIEPAGGAIIIDDVDIAKIGLNDLRSKLTIIPQDPVLFAGSIRLNLDPFSLYNDSELWTALKLAHLEAFCKTLDAGLEHVVSEGGENLSVGQRQLICLARALLRKPKILILDEATAAVDLETDDLVQKTIREEFSDCTILTIAHRLNTILDYDKVLVMDQGKVAEYDTPKALLEDSATIFHSLAKDAGLIS